MLAVLALAALAACAAAGAATYATGVDVSHWQGPIQWPRVAGASYTFAFGKATEGKTLVDPTYSINRSGAQTVGLRFGAYHFGRPGGSGEAGLVSNAIAQADFFLDVAQPQPGELPPVLDLETKGGLSPAALETWTSAWLGQVAARTGVKALVYASPSFWKTALADTTGVAADGNPLWVAHWTTKPAPLVPGANWGGQSWTFWQFTNKASVPGFAHAVDADRFRDANPSAVTITPYPGGTPVPSSPPTIVGTAQTGKTLAGVPGVWSGGKPLTFAYQWQRCDAAGAGCEPIAGATSETYLPVTDDVGHALVLGVSAQTVAGSANASSPPTVAVSAAGGAATRPAATTPPVMSGTAQVGQLLTGSVGTWTGSPTAFSYQWQRCTTQCVAIVGATTVSYTLTPDDIGATISLVVTATGRGGSTSAPAPATAAVVAAPVPAAVPGSAVAEPAAAGAVSAADGSATVTWQPGAVPAGSTVSLAPSGRGLLLGVSPAPPLLPWPVDLAYAAAPAGAIVGFSTDGKVWHAADRLAAPALRAGAVAGTYADAAGLVHVLLRVPARVALFEPGSWGDPSRVADGPPTPRRVAALRATRLRNGVVQVKTRVATPSQALLFVNVVGKTSVKRARLLRPGSLPVLVRVSGRRLQHGAVARLRIAARDPYGRRAALVLAFRAP
jgi:GH25 family lysozyme M1 (1,4-beta-N-acetylmuramidase)